jgi:hypothetical protein
MALNKNLYTSSTGCTNNAKYKEIELQILPVSHNPAMRLARASLHTVHSADVTYSQKFH